MRIYRPYKELGCQLRYRTPKRKVEGQLREDRRPASGHNEVWAMDFLHDQQFDGCNIRGLAEIDTFSRFSPALDPRLAHKAGDVVQALERAGKAVVYPRVIRIDNGPVFVSRDLDLSAYQRGVVLDSSLACKPADSAIAESFPDFTPLDSYFDQSRSKRTSRFTPISVADLLNST